MRASRRLPGIVCAALVSTPVSLAGQALLRGQVIDESTGKPVAEALLSVDPGGARLLSDTEGRFSVALGSDSVFVRVESLGYAPVERWIGPGDLGTVQVFRLSADPLAVEGLDVFVERLQERFERRRNASQGVVFVYGPEEMKSLGAENGFDLFWKVVRTARPCPGRSWAFCLARGSKDTPILVCIDDQKAWGGVNELLAYKPEDLYTVEVYDRGGLIRAYTQWWVNNRMTRRLLPPSRGQC